MKESSITADIDIASVKTEKPKKRLPNQNYPLLTREQCLVVAKRIMELRKHKLASMDIESIFSVNGYDNPRVTWQAAVLYRNSIFKTEDAMVDWMIQCDEEWLKKHPPSGPLNDSKGQCHTCGTELRFKLVCTCCGKIIT